MYYYYKYEYCPAGQDIGPGGQIVATDPWYWFRCGLVVSEQPIANLYPHHDLCYHPVPAEKQQTLCWPDYAKTARPYRGR